MHHLLRPLMLLVAPATQPSGPNLRELIKPVILLAFGGTLLLLAVGRLRRYRLKERYSLLFLFIGTPFLVLAAWPNAIGWLAHKLDIQYGTVTLLCVSAFLIVMIFELLTIVSLQDRKITTLAQIVGILMEQHGLGDRGDLDLARRTETPPQQPAKKQ